MLLSQKAIAYYSENADREPMREQYQGSVKSFVLAFIVLLVAHMTFTAHQPTVFRNEQGQAVGIHDLTVLFRVVSWTALVIGLLLVVNAIRTLFTNESRQEQSNSSPPAFGRRLFRNGRVWIVFNTVLIPLSIWTGYAEMAPTTLQRTNPDIILCISIFVLIPIFVLGAVSLATDKRRLRTPAWNRFPLNWGGDPLQALFIMTLCTLAAVVGSLFRLGSSRTGGAWTVAAHTSLLLGLLIGQAIVYRVYRDRIAHSGKGETKRSFVAS
jgi:hypothetical protein